MTPRNRKVLAIFRELLDGDDGTLVANHEAAIARRQLAEQYDMANDIEIWTEWARLCWKEIERRAHDRGFGYFERFMG